MDIGITIAVLALIVSLDTTAAGQFLVSQPLVSSILAGSLLGDLHAGVIVGTVMQLLWLKLMPAGGTVYLDGNHGSLAAISVFFLSVDDFIFSRESLFFCVILYGILTSYVFGYVTVLQRRVNSRLIDAARRSLRRNGIGLYQFYHVLGVIYAGLAGATATLIAAYGGKWLISHIPSLCYTALEPFSPYGLYAFIGIGAGTVFSMIWSKESWIFPLVGLGIGGALVSFL